jgi:hypothetical protein
VPTCYELYDKNALNVVSAVVRLFLYKFEPDMSAEQQGIGDENMQKLRQMQPQVEAFNPPLPS